MKEKSSKNHHHKHRKNTDSISNTNTNSYDINTSTNNDKNSVLIELNSKDPNPTDNNTNDKKAPKEEASKSSKQNNNFTKFSTSSNNSTQNSNSKSTYEARKSRKSRNTFYDKSNFFLSEPQKRYKVNVLKRDEKNNIYSNNSDQSIAVVIPYKYKFNIYMVIFLGIPYIITKFSNRKLIEWRGEPCKVSEAAFYLIIDGYGNYHISNFTKVSLRTHFSIDSRLKNYGNKYISTLFSNIDFSNQEEEFHEVRYVYNKYYCYRKKKENSDINPRGAKTKVAGNEDYYFQAPVFYLSNVTSEDIYEIFNNYFLDEKEVKFQLDIYEHNKLVLRTYNYIKILVEKLLNFISLYIILVIIFWWIKGYYFSHVVLLLSIILLLITSYQKYLNKKKVVDFSISKHEKIMVSRGPNKSPMLIDYEDLVPGQIIILKEKDVLPCDCLLLEGFCSCIESSLTGESSSEMKYKLPKNDSNFVYIENKKSFLFCGTKIENSFPNELRALVVGTGFNTQRGNLIQSVLFPKKSNYNFYKENIQFFIFSFVLFLIGTIIFIVFYCRDNEYNDNSVGILILNILDLLTIVFSPTLPLSMTLGTFYYQYSLINKKISCSGVYRLMASGKINKIIFDKTGTLTEEDLELYGYISSIKKGHVLKLDSREKNSKLYLSHLSEYYKNEFHSLIVGEKGGGGEEGEQDDFYRNSNNNSKRRKNDDTDNTITYFMECLATCHSVTKINDENKGNSIDIKIFNDVNWTYDSLSIKDKANDQFEVKPKKYFKLTEEQFFVKNEDNNMIKRIKSHKSKKGINYYNNKETGAGELRSSKKGNTINNINFTNNISSKGAKSRNARNNNDIRGQGSTNTNGSKFTESFTDALIDAAFKNSTTHKKNNYNVDFTEDSVTNEKNTNYNIDDEISNPTKKKELKNYYYKDNENDLNDNQNNEDKVNNDFLDNGLNSYKLKVIHRSHFESRNQSMSVIVKNNFNKTIRLFIKGAPEKIISQCEKKSIPSNYDEIYMRYTLQGFRVLACATKLIDENKSENEIICDTRYQNYKGNDLTFLGLILFQNKIKAHTKQVLQKLKNDGSFPIISTGDNAFTSISLVKECNLVENNSSFCILDIDRDEESNTNNNQNNKYSKYYNNNKSNIVLNCTFESVNYSEPSKNDNENYLVTFDNDPENLIMRKNKKNRTLITIGEFNNKLENKQNIKLCVNGHVFEQIFFRNGGEGTSSQDDDDILYDSSRLKENKEKNREELTKEELEDEQINLLRETIVDKGILFFSMNPNDKTKLVQLFKKQNPDNIVAMCGDGANDCSALISADVGVSLKSRENIIMTSHLMAKTKSITVINDIINIGKACYENSTIILKVLLIYAEIKITTRCLLKIKNDNLTKHQFFYLDCIIILFGSCLMSLSDPNYKLKEKVFSSASVHKTYLLSIIGHSIFQVGILIIYYFFIINENTDIYVSHPKINVVYSEKITTANSYMFFLNSVQCLSLVFSLNFYSLCKKEISKNRLFTFYLIFVSLILSEIISVEIFKVGIFNWNIVNFIKIGTKNIHSQISRLTLFGFCGVSFFIAMVWEFIVISIYSDSKDYKLIDGSD